MNAAKTWALFVALRGWEQFDPDLDNPGGADGMTEQAASVLARMSAGLDAFARDRKNGTVSRPGVGRER